MWMGDDDSCQYANVPIASKIKHTDVYHPDIYNGLYLLYYTNNNYCNQ